jgi:hypothetical protein
VCKRLQRRIDIDPKKMTSEVDALKDRFLSNLGGAMFLLLPALRWRSSWSTGTAACTTPSTWCLRCTCTASGSWR